MTDSPTTSPQNALAAFADFIVAQRSEINRHWVAAIDRSSEVETEQLTFNQLLDHFPQLCLELAETLKDPQADEPRDEAEANGHAHGRKRWQQGYRLEELLRELALVRRDFLGRWLTAFEASEGELSPEVRHRASRIVDRFFDDLIVSSTLQFVDEHQERLAASEAEMCALKERAEAADAARNRFIMMISHELRTPLTPVLLSASALAAEKDLPPHQRELAGVIEHNARAEAALIDDLLDASRLTRRAFRLTTKETEVHDCLEAALMACARDFAMKEIEPELHLAARPAHLPADRPRLERALATFLRNAINVSPTRGRISVSTRTIADRVKISIEDSGEPFSDRIAEVIFHPFEAGRSSPFGVGRVGLSRYVAKAIVEAHGGDIRARPLSDTGGAAFIVTLSLLGAG